MAASKPTVNRYFCAEGGTRTPTGLLPPAPQADAATITPLPHKISQNKSRIRTDSHRLRAYAGYSPEPGITLRVFQFAPPYPSRLDWTRIRDFHHIFSGVIRISLLPPSPTQGGASNISANSRGGAGWSRTTDTGIFSPVLYRLSYRPIFTLSILSYIFYTISAQRSKIPQTFLQLKILNVFPIRQSTPLCWVCFVLFYALHK